MPSNRRRNAACRRHRRRDGVGLQHKSFRCWRNSVIALRLIHFGDLTGGYPYLMLTLTEAEIGELIREAKDIPEGLSVPVRLLSERNRHRRKEYEIKTESGNIFVVKIRQSCANPMDFSVVLGYMLPGTYTVFRLRRYNGKHRHTNALEGESFYDFHVHTATERYQIPGFDVDHFAQRTSRYYDLDSAVHCLMEECGFRPPLEGTPLFPRST